MKLAEGTPAAPAHDGGDGAAGLRPVRLQLRGLLQRASFGKKEERLNLCVPGGKETARMLKTLHEEFGDAPPPAADDCRRRPAAPSPRPTPAVRATIPVEATFLSRTPPQQAGLGERDLACRDSILPACGHRLQGRRFLRPLPDQRSGAGRRRHRRARRAGRFPDRRAHAARGADRRRFARARAGHAVPAVLLHHRRRAAAKGARRWRPARTRMATPQRSTCWPRSRNSPACAPIRKPSSRRSIRCSRGSIRSRPRPRSTPAAWR